MAGFVLFYTSRVIFKGHVTMEEIVFTLKHHWMTVDYEPFELYAIACYPIRKHASILDKRIKWKDQVRCIERHIIGYNCMKVQSRPSLKYD
jgi:hypothetical protein